MGGNTEGCKRRARRRLDKGHERHHLGGPLEDQRRHYPSGGWPRAACSTAHPVPYSTPKRRENHLLIGKVRVVALLSFTGRVRLLPGPAALSRTRVVRLSRFPSVGRITDRQNLFDDLAIASHLR